MHMKEKCNKKCIIAVYCSTIAILYVKKRVK